MKNVIVFALDQRLCAVELRWVREMFTLGYVTPVPSAPRLLDGIVNLRGTITPVLDLGLLLNEVDPDRAAPTTVVPRARRGNGAILLEVEGMVAAFRVSNVEEVSTLSQDEQPDTLIDSRGRRVTLIDPRRVLERALDAVGDARGLHPGLVEAAHGS